MVAITSWPSVSTAASATSPDVAPDEIHHDPAALRGRLGLLRGERRNAVETSRAEAGELEDRRHRVRRELPPAGAGAGTGGSLELVQVLFAELPGGVRADPL